MSGVGDLERIVLPQRLWQEILAHCRRKLAGDYLEGETPIKRAYGILAGVRDRGDFQVRLVLPVKRNARDQEPLKSWMDRMMAAHAIPSTTPSSQRGWITDPVELMACMERCDREGLIPIGAYHMHIVPWKGDPLRDTPTRLDAILARGSNLFAFILSLVDIERPTLRAFFEGDIQRETPLVIQD